MIERWRYRAGAAVVLVMLVSLAGGAVADAPLGLLADATRIASGEAKVLAEQLRARIQASPESGEQLPVLRLAHRPDPEGEPGQAARSVAGAEGGSGERAASGEPPATVGSSEGAGAPNTAGPSAKQRAERRSTRRARSSRERPRRGSRTSRQIRRKEALERRLLEDAERLSGGMTAGAAGERTDQSDRGAAAASEPPLHAEPGSVGAGNGSGRAAEGARGGAGSAAGYRYRGGSGSGASGGSGGGARRGGVQSSGGGGR